jgi:hypothetical protein
MGSPARLTTARAALEVDGDVTPVGYDGEEDEDDVQKATTNSKS